MSGTGSPPPPGSPDQPPRSTPGNPGQQHPAPGYPPPGQVPPGYVPPGAPPPGVGHPGNPYAAPAAPPPYGYPPPYGQPAPYAAMRPAHKPGVIALRPLSLGDIYDAAFKIIRFNAAATVGSAVLVTAAAMAIPILVTATLVATHDFSTALDSNGDISSSDLAGLFTAYGSMFLGGILQALGLIFVTGMVVHVTAAAAAGRRLSLAAAWAATRGKRWRLVGLSFALSLGVGLAAAVTVGAIFLAGFALDTAAAVLVIAGLVVTTIVLLVFFWVRVYYLAVPPLMLEPVGVFAAMGRSFALTRGQFWRTFGIALLTVLITQIAASVLGIPFSLVGAFASVAAGTGGTSLMIIVVANSLSTVVSSAFVTPFLSAVTSLQYLDQRIRKEGYDVELMTQAGLLQP